MFAKKQFSQKNTKKRFHTKRVHQKTSFTKKKKGFTKNHVFTIRKPVFTTKFLSQIKTFSPKNLFHQNNFYTVKPGFH